MFTPSITTCPVFLFTLVIFPTLPLSAPVITLTVSPVFTWRSSSTGLPLLVSGWCSQSLPGPIRPARTTRALLADAVVLREEAASACPLKLFVANAFIFTQQKEDYNANDMSSALDAFTALEAWFVKFP